MWLLHTSTLQLEYFDNAPYQTYATLSHTWGFEEVTFQDVRDGKAKDRLGYAKVVGTCEKARSHGLSWVWIDTCCINKESSAELSEAINSMFTWYARSAICYAYLYDVAADHVWLDWSTTNIETLIAAESDPLALLTYTEDDWRIICQKCRWFKRGWTLQELIAPVDLRFYNRSWSFMGSKKSLLLPLWHATGIDPLALEDYQSMPKFTIARRMSWAAGRFTTRREDRAYSLFGLLGVNMPLLYGEGEYAFVRLQEELVRTSTDQSVFAWKPAEEDITKSRSRRDVRESLFARSPDDYRSARRIVRWHAEDDYKATMPFRLANHGVIFDGISTARTSVGKLLLLNCRYEDKPEGPIALRVLDNNGTVNLQDECWVDYDHRLTVYDWWRNPARPNLQHRSRLSLLRRPPEPPPDRNSTTPHAVMFHFVKEDTSEDIQIQNPDPISMWNAVTGVMCPPFLDKASARREVTGSAMIRGKASGFTFWIAFSSSRFVRERTVRIAISMHSQSEAQRSLDTKRNEGANADQLFSYSSESDSDDESLATLDSLANDGTPLDRWQDDPATYDGEGYGSDTEREDPLDASEILERRYGGVPHVIATLSTHPGVFARLKEIRHIADHVYHIIEVSTGVRSSPTISPRLSRRMIRGEDT